MVQEGIMTRQISLITFSLLMVLSVQGFSEETQTEVSPGPVGTAINPISVDVNEYISRIKLPGIFHIGLYGQCAGSTIHGRE